MPNLPLNSSSSFSDDPSESLTDRIAARVISARLALEQQPRSGRPRSKRSASAAARRPVEAGVKGELRETQSLHRVFRDLGVTYRSYRSQTNSPLVPGLKDAAYRFRADPSLESLVAVAAYLDDLDLLS
jgi:hypothetical protein